VGGMPYTPAQSMSAQVVPTLTQSCIGRSAISPYSPDFSLLENLWSKLKIILRSIKTTNYQELGTVEGAECGFQYWEATGFNCLSIH